MRALVIALAALFPVASNAGTSVAILAVAGADGGEIDKGLRAGLAEIGGYDIQADELTRAHVSSASGMGVRCQPGDDACLFKLGVLAEVNALLVPSRTDAGLALRLIDVSAREVSAQLSYPLRDGPNESARRAVVTLLKPELALGSIVVVAPAGATVSLDGKAQGTAPLSGPLTGVAPGEHLVRADLDGHQSARQRVVLNFAGNETVELSPSPTPVAADPVPVDAPRVDDPAPITETEPAPTGGLGVITLTGAALTGASAIGTASLLAVGAFFEIEVDRLGKEIATDADVEQFNQTQQTAAAVWVTSMVAAGVLVLSTGVLAAGLLLE